MITISATQSTIITCTLQENTIPSANYYYTWSITAKGTNVNIIFTQQDISTNPFFYNQFLITPATTTQPIGLTQGIIPIFPAEWSYVVYQMPQLNDLNLNDSITVVEQGIIIVPEIATQSAIPGYNYQQKIVIPGPGYNPLT